MKLRQLGIAIVALAMLAACNGRRETSLTGAYGHGMLSGEVVMADGSPAGVVVSVRGTGMSMTLADDGQFAFGGVPAGAQLDFRREAGGIEASLSVEGSGHLTIELDKTTATAKKGQGSSKRRSVGRSRDLYEFEGVIRTADADKIVLFTSKKVEQEIALGDDTVIRKGSQLLAAADLKTDMRVHVKARKADDVYTAVLVIVQQMNDDDDDGDDDAPPAVREYEGTVRSASATALVIFTSHKQEVTFTITAGTVIRKGNTPIAAEDIQEGWRVHVKATAKDGTATATRVTVQSTKTK